jgi:hypothetical protein
VATAVHVLRRPAIRASARRRAGELAVALVVAAIAAALTWFVAREGLLRGGLIALGTVGFLWLATTRRTGLALILFMVYVGAFDGYLKLRTGSSLVTLLRDVLLFAIVIGLLVRAQVRGESLRAPPLTAWIFAFVVLVLVQLLNPQAGTLYHSLAGVRQHLEFVPLFFLTYAYVRSTKALRTFVIVLVLLGAANGLVGWVQLGLTPQQFAAWGPGYAERVLGQGSFAEAGRTFLSREPGVSRVRPFGLGSDAGSGGFVGVYAIGGILALASLLTRPRYVLFAALMAIGVAAAVATSQGRAVIVCAFAVPIAYGLLTATSRGRMTGLLGLCIAVLAGALVYQAVVATVGSRGVRYGELSTQRILESTEEARGESLAAIPQNVVDYPLGAGLATAGPASETPGKSELTGVLDAESELSFMTVETGVAGMLLMTGFTVMLFVLGLRRVRHEPDREARALLAAVIAPIAAILLLFPVGGGLTATTPGGPYLWAVAGIVSYWLVARPAERRRALAEV